MLLKRTLIIRPKVSLSNPHDQRFVLGDLNIPYYLHQNISNTPLLNQFLRCLSGFPSRIASLPKHISQSHGKLQFTNISISNKLHSVRSTQSTTTELRLPGSDHAKSHR